MGENVTAEVSCSSEPTVTGALKASSSRDKKVIGLRANRHPVAYAASYALFLISACVAGCLTRVTHNRIRYPPCIFRQHARL